MRSSPLPVGLIDLIKALASQLIIWHHFALYSPLTDLSARWLPGTFAWLSEYGRLAVPAFLVVSGFLTARGLRSLLLQDTPPAIWQLAGRRYLRLVRPYALALLAAISCAAITRLLIDHEHTPAAPNARQILSHLLLLQDIVGADALSSGVWYVAIDFQLYGLCALLAGLCWHVARRLGWHAPRLFGLVCFALTVLSLFWFNRSAGLDVWAPYFFASYGLGMLAYALSQRRLPWLGSVLLIVLAGGALAVDWRVRILLAALVALALLWASQRSGWCQPTRWRVVAWLSRISYAAFLVHYPVCLLVSAVVSAWWPDNLGLNVSGLLIAWGTSLWCAHLLHHHVEAAPVGRFPDWLLQRLGRTASR